MPDPSQNILITFEADPSGLAPGVEGLEKIGQLDKQTADSFSKTNDQLKQRQKIVGDNESALQSYVQDLLKVQKATAGAFGMKGLQDFEKEIGKSANSMKILQASITLAKQNLDKFKPNTPEWQKLNDTIKQGDALLKMYTDTENKASTSEASFRSQISQSTEALAQRLVTGEATVAEIYNEAKAAGGLKDAYRDATQAIAALSSDTFAFDAISQGVQTATGAMQVFTGVSALAGTENEDLQRTLVKLNAVMAISSGLQQVINSLQKQSALSLAAQVVWTKAQSAANTVASGTFKLLGISVEGSEVAFKSFTTILATTGIGLLIVGLGLLVEKLSSFKTATTRAADAQRELNEQLDEGDKAGENELNELKRREDIRIAQLKAGGASAKAVRDKELQDLQNNLSKFNEINAAKVKAAEDAQKKLDQINQTGGFIETGKVDINGFREVRKAAEDEVKALKENTDKGNQILEQRKDFEKDIAVKRLENTVEDNKEIDEARKQDLKNQEDDAEKAKQIAEANAQAIFNIRQRALQSSVDFFNKIANDSSFGGQIQLDALQKTLDAQNALIALQKNFELSKEGLTAVQKKDIIDKYNHDAEKLTQEGYDQRKQIIANANVAQVVADQAYYNQLLTDQQNFIDRLNNNVDQQFQKINDNNSKEQVERLKNVEDEYKKGNISLSEFLQQRENINGDYDSRDINNQIGSLEAKISNLKAFGFDTTDLERQLNEKLKEKYGQDAQHYQDATEKKLKATEELINKRLELEEAGLQASSEILGALNEAQKQSLQDQAEANQDLYNRKLITQDEYNKRQKKLKQEEAALNKQKALLDIFIEATKRIFEIQAQAAVLGANPLTLPLAAKALSAIPLLVGEELIAAGLVAARKFKKGGFTGDFSVDKEVGIVHGKEFVSHAAATEKYRPALEAMNQMKFDDFLMKQVRMFDMPVMKDIPAAALQSVGGDIDYERLGESVAKHMSDVVSNIPQTGFTWDEDGVHKWTRKRNELVIYLNKRFGYKP